MISSREIGHSQKKTERFEAMFYDEREKCVGECVNRGDGISMVQRKHKVINWNNNGMRNDVFPFAPLNGTFALAANFTAAYLNSVNRIILNICRDNMAEFDRVSEI